ncbi:MAG: M81 family metallopeptidase [Tissierellia bacterium]|nr:M81 family metallopeptidase [Tissierellia bacterium]MDD4725171.1 M81 family metallopeptidase [Tissierellia bacterium]
MGYKIAIGGIHIESSTFTPYISGESDFKIKRGQELLNSYSWLKDFSPDIECIPLVYARAIPGGIVSKAFYSDWHKEFISLLKKAISENQIDGLLFDIHGAMSVEGMQDAEGIILEEIREIVGKSTVISTTMDLHGNVSDKLFYSSDLLNCHRTAPHIDTVETKKRAFENLIKVLKNNRDKLVRAKVDIPILLPGEKTSTEVEPGKSLYAKLDEICNNDDIIDASIWMGFPWADQPRCHAAIVITGIDKELIKIEAEKLADKFWNLRNEFKFVGPVEKADEAISLALSSKVKPFFLSDTGDNPGAGGVGDMNLLLKKFLELNKSNKIDKRILFSSIFDSKSIEVLYENKIGSNVLLSLGGKSDLSFGGPAEIEVTIDFFFRDYMAGRSAVVCIDNISVIITENRYQYGTREAFIKAGINNLTNYDIIVVKMGYLEPDLSKVAKGWIMALTPGSVRQDIINIQYKYLKRPLFPLESQEFKPELHANIVIG